MLVIAQINVLSDIVGLVGPTNFIILVGLYGIYQIYSPEIFPNTKFQKIIVQFENRITDIEDNLSTQLDSFESKQLAHIQITRAIASVKNPAEEIDESVVDSYLVQNGIDKQDFLLGESGERKRNRGPNSGQKDRAWFDNLSDEQVARLMRDLESYEKDEISPDDVLNRE